MQPNFSLFLFLEMDLEDAYRILGATEVDSLEKIKNKYRKLMRKYHPDRNPSGEKQARDINNAWDAIQMFHSSPGTRPPRSEKPEWETDSGGGSYRVGDDFRNVNYFKKRIWEAAKEQGPIEKVTVWAFDGHFFRNSLTVWGNRATYFLMGKGMEIWNSLGANSYPTEAVLVTTEDKPNAVTVIRIKGKDVNFSLEHESFNQNPSNDPHFADQLKRLIKEFA